MPRAPREPLQQVNAQLWKADVDEIKALARAEGSDSWHPKLRQAVRLGLKELRRIAGVIQRQGGGIIK